MKALVLAALLTQVSAFAEPMEQTRVLKDTTTWVAISLTPQTVFCTDRGYGTVQLKVSVPDLEHLAHFDHRVVGERLPCITGGLCKPGNNPSDLIQSNERLAVAPIRVVLKETTILNEEGTSCQRQLTEEITSQIRGHRFTHQRANELIPVDVEKCQQELGL